MDAILERMRKTAEKREKKHREAGDLTHALYYAHALEELRQVSEVMSTERPHGR
jgi:hypothetical protein